jgi:hydroxyacylglutathione hydrolase
MKYIMQWERRMKISNNLFAYIWKGNDNNCNTFLFANILQNNKHIIIDPGHIITPYLREPAFEMLIQQIVKDGLKTEDIGLVLLTHAHPDHFESSIKFREQSKALIALHNNEKIMYNSFDGPEPDLFVEEGLLKLTPPIQDKLEIINTPGHSSGEISFYWPSHKALAVGDVIFYHNTGRVDLPGGDAYQLKTSIEKLSKLDVEYLLCGHPYGHPGVIQGKEAIKKNFDFVLKNIFS